MAVYYFLYRDSAINESSDLGYSSIAAADLTAADFEDFRKYL